MELKDFAKQLEGLAVLDEPIRRRLYDYVARQQADVSRDQAARATRVSRALAAFHLDKLVKAGLLEATFRRLSKRSGPGAGRPAKLYRRPDTQFEVSLPQRRYELAAHVLAEAFAEVKAQDGVRLLRNAARNCGQRLASDASLATRAGPPLHRATRALQVCGYEPRKTTDGEVVLGNCPFQSLRADHRELICGMNLALVEGLIEGLDLEGVRAVLAPRVGACCVALREQADEEAAEQG